MSGSSRRPANRGNWARRLFVGGRTGGGSDVRQGQTLSTIEGCFANVHIILVSGAFLTGFALMLGLKDFHLGLIGALPAFANIPGVFSAWLSERVGSRKTITFVGALVSRLLWLPMLALAFLPLDPETRIWWFVGLFAASSLAGGFAGNSWLSWMSDLVPARLRGRYWGHRNRVLNMVSIVVMLAGGWAVDFFRAHDAERAGFAVILLIACFFAVLAALTLRRQYEPPMAPIQTNKFFANLRKPLMNREYFLVIKAFGIFQFFIGLVAPFIAAYMLEYLKLNFTTISLYSIYGLVIGLFFNPFWGQIMDKVGIRSVLLLNLAIIGLLPFAWILSLSFGGGFVLLVFTLSGIGWSGFNLAAFNLPFSYSPPEGRTYYLAVLNISNGALLFCGSLVGGILAQAMRGFELHIGPIHIIHYHILMLVSALGRLSAGLLFARIHDVRCRGLLYTMQLSSNIFYSRLMSTGRLLFFPRRGA
ncbi:MFS transporter [bacterium]|nr:MFS transporter [bacterium]